MGVLKKVLIGVGAVVGLGAVGVGGFAFIQARAFDASMDKVYTQAPLDNIKASTDEAVIARGKHLVDAVAGCSSKDCHGKDLSGGNTLVMGPLGSLTGPNITGGGLGAAYTDGEIARLIRYGIKKSGKSALFMPAQELNWLPDDEIVAVISYVRTVAKSDKANGPIKLGLLGKVLDRQGAIPLDVARKVEAAGKIELAGKLAGKPEPTAAYGKFLAKGCTGCHGDTLSGGRIPGAPGDLPVPLNLTPHETGLKGWTQEDFNKLLEKGDRKNGAKLNPFMPIENYGQMDATEKTALFSYLQSVSPKPFGGR
jgi:mono/diheme cytochrome c family protein